ncbi:MAG: hypothetical protein MUQ10_07940 [Anaerolineae bacterium]|nr:hypothetical protein [Anaerolineae bacterium]
MTLADLVHNLVLLPRNIVRSVRLERRVWVELPFRGVCPEVTTHRPLLLFPPRSMVSLPVPVSLETLSRMFLRATNSRQEEGVVLRFDGLRADLAIFYSLRRMVVRLRETGRQAIARLPSASLWRLLSRVCLRSHYATSIWPVAGSGAIAEYNVARATFRRPARAGPHREMLDAVLELIFADVVTAIAWGRDLDVSTTRSLVDAMPMLPSDALASGFIDAAAYVDELLNCCVKQSQAPDSGRRPSAHLLHGRSLTGG